MFIAGNISTGIWTTLTAPRIATIRQTTTIRYGVLMANRDMRLLRSRRRIGGQADYLGLDFIALLQAGARSDYDAVPLLQVSRSNFAPLRRFDAKTDRNNLDRTGWLDGEDAGRISGAVNGFRRNGEYVFALVGGQVHLGVHTGHQQERRVGNIDLRLHRSRGLIDSILKASNA